MNYFAHGMRFVERPWFLAGTAAPDWLSVVDRRVRLRPPLVEPFLREDGSPAAEFAAGVLQHFHDDQWFHRTPAFWEVSGSLCGMLRDLLGEDSGYRIGFLGHIFTELLLDAELIDRQPALLSDYYHALAEVDPAEVEALVNAMAKRQTTRLGAFLPLFIQERFLQDYGTSVRLLHRLNQVMRRVRLEPLPDCTITVLDSGRALVAQRVDDLLPQHHFGRQPITGGPTP